MASGTNTTLMTVLIVLATQVPLLWRQWQGDRAAVLKSLRLAGYYLVYCLAGIGLMFAMLQKPGAAVPALGFMLGWILFGMSWLIKLAPKGRQVGAWLLRPFGILDGVAVAMMAISLIVFLSGALAPTIG